MPFVNFILNYFDYFVCVCCMWKIHSSFRPFVLSKFTSWKFVETHKLYDLQTTGAAIYNTHRYSKMTWASIYWWSHFAGKTFFLNSHLHHSFPTWDNDAHTLFSISFFSFEISAFTFLLFSFRAYVFYAYLCVCIRRNRPTRKDNATFGPVCHVMPKLHFHFWQLPQLIDGNDECGKRLPWHAYHSIEARLSEKSSLCAFHIPFVSLQVAKNPQPLFDFIHKPNELWTAATLHYSNMIALWLTDLFVCLNI